MIESNPVNQEHEAQKVQKAVVIMYPDVRTTTGEVYTPGEESISLMSRCFANVTSNLIQRYRRVGFQVFAVNYSDSSESTQSELYPFEFDKTFKTTTTNSEWSGLEHEKELAQIVPTMNLNLNADVIVGGFHATDCVVKMVKALRKKGFNADPNLLLTNELGFLVVGHTMRKGLGILYRYDSDKHFWELKKKTIQELLDK